MTIALFSHGFKIAAAQIGTNLSFDAQYARRRQLAAQQKAQNAKQGIRMGAEALRDGLTSGLVGIVQQPVREAMRDGAKGAVKGSIMGLAGAFAKPMSGLAGFGAKVAEGLGSPRVASRRTGDESIARASNSRGCCQEQLDAEGVGASELASDAL